MKGYIYKLTCTITGKVYIGKTIDINRRMAQHSKITSKYSHHLANAIKKYGIDNFKEEIIFEVEAEDRAVLNTTLSNAEKSYIEQYDSYRNGYNSTIGGEGTGGFHWLESSKKKLSESLKKFFESAKGKAQIGHTISCIKNREVSKETREKIGKGNKGKKMLEEAKIKIRKYQLANAFSKYVPVLQYNLNNNLLNRFNSITDAAKNINKDTSHIVSCCKGRRKTAYGFIWKYEEKEVIHG